MSYPRHSAEHRSRGIQFGRRFLLSVIAALSCSCNGEPGILVNIAAWPDGVERIRVRMTLEGTLGADSYVNKDQARFAVRLPVGSAGTVRLDAVGLDATDCKLVSGTLTEPVPKTLNHFVERTMELNSLPERECVLGKAKNLPVDTNPSSLTAADLNGDGSLDLVAAIPGSGIVGLWYGNGDGEFSNYKRFPAGTKPFSVAIGDFDNDMKPDLAIANNTNMNEMKGSVTILKGNSGFNSMISFATAPNPGWVAVGDFNNDNKQDIVVVRQKDSIGIAFGNGQFVFSDQVGVPPTAIEVAVGDFNGDKRPDIAAGTTAGVVVRLGVGQGFGTPIGPHQDFNMLPKNINPNSQSVALGDFNGDGNLDISSANYDSDNVSLLMGNGQGGFSQPEHFPADKNPISIAVGDFNDDKKLDIVVANSTINKINILLGNGQGKFGAPTYFQVGMKPGAVVVGDFNRDLKPDLAVANYDASTISVLLNQF